MKFYCVNANFMVNTSGENEEESISSCKRLIKNIASSSGEVDSNELVCQLFTCEDDEEIRLYNDGSVKLYNEHSGLLDGISYKDVYFKIGE